MSELKVIQFVLLISFVIFSTHALTVLLSDGTGPGGFEHETEILVSIGADRKRYYSGCTPNITYTKAQTTEKVIVNIRNYDELRRNTLRIKCLTALSAFAEMIRRYENYELLYLGVDGSVRGNERVIGEFLLRTINISRTQINVFDDWHLIYETTEGILERFEWIHI